MAKQKPPAGRKPGQIVSRGPDRWLVRVYVGINEEGKRRYVSKVISGKFKQAQAYLGTQLSSLEQRTFVPPAKQTVREFLRSWLDDTASQKVSASTLRSYRERLKAVEQRIGHLKLDRVAHQTIQALYKALQDELKYSSRTVRYTHTVLSQAFKKAVAWRVLPHNPCDNVTLPKKEGVERQVWTTEQVNTFLNATREHPWHALWELLLNTGMRPGEAFGLKWGDLEGSRIRVQRAVIESQEKGQYTIGEPKTKKSRRTVTLADSTLQALKAHRAHQAEEILAAGETYQRQDFIFPNQKGGFLNIHAVDARWETCVRKSGLPRITLYGCRHTHATVLLMAAVNPKVVSERLGHASIVITLDTYSHVLPDMQEEVAAKLGALRVGSAKV
jgi:integrase